VPSDGGLEHSPEALKHQANYWGAIRRQEREREQERRREEQRERKTKRDDDAWYAKYQRDERRALRNEAAGHAAELRLQARDQLNALRESPEYGLYKTWGPRVDRGTMYDAITWRQSGRLVPVPERMRYTAGGGARREVVDWVDILDREAQELGMDVQELPNRFTQLDKQVKLAQSMAREADRARDAVRSA
jgi:hypothetical protein